MLYSDNGLGDTNSQSGLIRSWYSGEQVEPGDLVQLLLLAKIADCRDCVAVKFDDILTIHRSFYKPRAFAQGTVGKTLYDTTPSVTNSVSKRATTTDLNVTTQNMDKDRGRRTTKSGEHPDTADTAYKMGDTRVSNLRP